MALPPTSHMTLTSRGSANTSTARTIRNRAAQRIRKERRKAVVDVITASPKLARCEYLLHQSASAACSPGRRHVNHERELRGVAEDTHVAAVEIRLCKGLAKLHPL